MLSYYVMKEILKFNKYYKDHKSFKNLVARILYKIFTAFLLLKLNSNFNYKESFLDIL